MIGTVCFLSLFLSAPLHSRKKCTVNVCLSLGFATRSTRPPQCQSATEAGERPRDRRMHGWIDGWKGEGGRARAIGLEVASGKGMPTLSMKGSLKMDEVLRFRSPYPLFDK